MGRFFKTADYAIGIPDINKRAKLPSFTEPQKWEYVLHSHAAKRAGQHFDLRLGDPVTGQAHSWAMRYWPAPGEKTLAVMQPTHTVGYMDFEGTIPEGYGAGTVEIADRDKIELIKSSPDKITFHRYKGPNVEKYTLIHTGGDNWLLVNHTHSGELQKYHQESPKLHVRDLTYKYTPKEGDVSIPKIDGAYSTMILRPNKGPIVFSSRISKRSGLPIEYTPKINQIQNKIVPKELGNTVLQTEVFAYTPDYKEIPNRTLGGILNSNVWKSREMQKELGAPLRLAAFNVLKYKGQDVRNLPIDKRLELIDEIKAKYPFITTPREAAKKITFGEGHVVWRNGVPYKVKNKPDYDVYVRNIFPAYSKGVEIDRAGGFEYSWTPKGKIVGRVGTGFTHEELRDMKNNPNDYIGRVAKTWSMGVHPSGALRAPSFEAWHTDKGEMA